MSSSSEPITRRIHAPFIPTPAIQAERQALRAEIEQDKAKLELLRVKETELRAELVRELAHLAANAARAEFKIQTRQWEDGCAALDSDFESMKNAEESLMECVDDIAHTEAQITDSQNDLDNAQLWQEAS